MRPGSPWRRCPASQRAGGPAAGTAGFTMKLSFRSSAKGTSAAEDAAGVVLVMTHRNAPRLNPAPAFLAAEKGAAGDDDLPIMQAVR